MGTTILDLVWLLIGAPRLPLAVFTLRKGAPIRPAAAYFTSTTNASVEQPCCAPLMAQILKR